MWVQGCSIGCAGCFNSHMWPRDGGRVVDVEELAARVVQTSGIEGVTFLGGEPFEQANALGELGGRVRAHGLSVLTFSGYGYDHLVDSAREDWIRLLSATDLLIDGPYDRTQPDVQRPWVGSRNQSFRFLTSRYLHLRSRLGAIHDRVEVRISSDGRTFINGMCSQDFLHSVRKDLGRESGAESNRRLYERGRSKRVPTLAPSSLHTADPAERY